MLLDFKIMREFLPKNLNDLEVSELTWLLKHENSI